jgi:hypothetical protein
MQKMNNIKVVYDDGLGTLFSKLKKKQFNIDKVSKEELIIEIRDKEEYSVFIEILNRYIIKEHFNKATKSIMRKKGYDNDFIQYMLEVDNIKNIDKVDYFKIGTEILLLEYFKSMDVINLKAFMNLNMRGFKNEAKFVVEVAEDYITANAIDPDDDDYMSDYMDDISNALATLIQSNELNPADFKAIKLNIFEDDSIEIIDTKGSTHTIESIGEKLGIELQGLFATTSSCIEASILFTSLIVSVMRTSKIIVQKGFDEFKNILQIYLQSMELTVDVVEE